MKKGCLNSLMSIYQQKQLGVHLAPKKYILPASNILCSSDSSGSCRGSILCNSAVFLVLRLSQCTCKKQKRSFSHHIYKTRLPSHIDTPIPSVK